MMLSSLPVGRRGPVWWAVAALLLGVLWVVPRAAAASTGATSSTAARADADVPQCAPTVRDLPPGSALPEGLPPTFPCVLAHTATGATTQNPPQLTGVRQLGVQGAPHLGQWIKIPLSAAAGVVPLESFLDPNSPEVKTAPAGTRQFIKFSPQVVLLSADRARAGEIPPFRVKSLAFGAIPVEVTVSITQPRINGAVVPLALTQSDAIGAYPQYPPQNGGAVSQVYSDAVGGGPVNVRLSDATVDGVPLRLGEACQTRSPAQLSVVGKGYPFSTAQGQAVPAGKYNSRTGGRLTGTLDIPAFSGCTSPTGDDVSPLMTNLVSGAGAPIQISQGGTNNFCFPGNDPVKCATYDPPDLAYPTPLPQTTSPPADGGFPPP